MLTDLFPFPKTETVVLTHEHALRLMVSHRASLRRKSRKFGLTQIENYVYTELSLKDISVIRGLR